MKIITPTTILRVGKVSLLVLTMFLLQACPFESNVPITEKNILFPPEYLGTWYEKDGNDGVLEYKKYIFRELDDTTFYMDEMELNDADRWETATYKCHLSYVGEDLFINVKPTAKNEETYYYLYSALLDGDQIAVKGVTGNIPNQFEHSDSLYNYIEKYKHLDFFYENSDNKTLVQWGSH